MPMLVWMNSGNEYDRRGRRASDLMRRRAARTLAVLSLLALAACDIDGLFRIGGEGRMARRVEQPEAVQKEDIKAIQNALAELGYHPGPIDGIAGANTRSAIRRYQAAAGLPVDGKVSMALLESLRTNPVPAPAPADHTLPPPDTGRDVATDDVVIDSRDHDVPPLYETGDVFAWSDGLVETVIRIGEDRVFWRVSNGTSFNADRNFVVPPSSWDRASGPESATVSVDARRLWPIRPGTQVSFRVTTTGPSGTESEREWTCLPQGKKKVTVPAGTFDTHVITCQRSSVGDGEWRYRTWFYAPAARHYVRRVDRYTDGSIEAIGLVAIRPGGKGWPAAARAGLDWAIQDALNGRPTGSRADWSSTSIRANFVIMPTGSRETEDGNGCRTFVLIRQSRDDDRSYPAVACQDAETGAWLVPVLDPGALPAGDLMKLGQRLDAGGGAG